MTKNNFIVGGGISGCIFAFYNQEYSLIMPKEDKVDNPFVFIHSNKYTEKLIKDLEIECDKTEVRVYSESDKELISKMKIHENKNSGSIGTNRIAYIEKDRPFLKALKITESEIIKKIIGKIENRIIYGKVDSIDTCNRKISIDGIKFDYENIVSTINYRDFSLLSGWDYGEKSTMSDLKYKIENNISKISEIRYSEIKAEKKIVINSIQGKMAIEYSKEYEGDCIIAKNARISGQINPSPEGVIFIGRFATGNPHWQIEDSIFCAKNIGFYEMLNSQKRFDKFVIEKSGIDGDERMKNLILGAHSELSDLLKEIPWEMHKRRVKRKVEANILLELIDCLKYIFSMMNSFNYTPREIHDCFYEKEKINWERVIFEFYGGV